MGLLTDPRAGTGKVTKLVLQWEKLLCFVLYVGGCLWIMLLALPLFNDSTYFSENALLPGLVTKESNLDQMSKQFYYELYSEMKRYPDNMPYGWLVAKLNQIHLDVYEHNFTLKYAFRNQKFTGQNVYGIVKAPKAASTEAIVVSVPFRPLNSMYQSTAPSIALLLAFAKFCRKQRYWAKDIIFLITEHEQLGMQAWLDAYHGVNSGEKDVLMAGDLSGRAGSIQTAVNLELHAMKLSSIDVKVEGLNGQLPNLDLFNLAQNMIAKEGIQHSFQRRFDINTKNLMRKWWYHFNTMSRMIATQATGIPTGNHGLFHRFGIQAITLEGMEDSGGGSNVNYYQVGRIVESIVRSLNNLLERFHQSYFFYLLPSTDRYISIGLYMRPLMLIIASLFIKAFAMWQKLQTPNVQNDVKKNVEIQRVEVKDFDFSTITSKILWTHTFGALLISSPKVFTLIGSRLSNLPTEDSIYFGLAAVSILTLLWPFCWRRSVKYENLMLIYVIALVELAATLMCLAMYNFSLSFLIAVVYTPVLLLITPREIPVPRLQIVLRTMCVLLHPFVILSVIIMGFTYSNFSEESVLSLIARGHRATKYAFILSIIDSIVYGNWFYNVSVAIMLPIWLLFWNITCSKAKLVI